MDGPGGATLLGATGGSIMVRAFRLGVAAVFVAASAEVAVAAPDSPGSAVDAYLAAADEASLVGGPGSAGYDAGFWIRGGDFLLRLNLTLQARFEAVDNDEQVVDDQDLSGFSLPRAVVKLSGEAPCNTSWYLELDFGHEGVEGGGGNDALGPGIFGQGWFGQSDNFDNSREAWIEWGACPTLRLRFGQVAIPTTRQLLTPPELQQFVDISVASSVTGIQLPGYTDRNRDFGWLIHGVLGCEGRFSYMVSITNGEGGDSIRNVLDERTSDNLAYGARVNWAFLGPVGYEEGALRQNTCTWYGEVGVWGFAYAFRKDKPHENLDDTWRAGIDLALGYGGLSATAAYSVFSNEGGTFDEQDFTTWLVQLGYLFPGTAWEVAARWDGFDMDLGFGVGSLSELAVVVNYYLNGHGNKLSLDVSFLDITSDDFTFFQGDPYPGFNSLSSDFREEAVLLRFQWQLAL
jgi:hypothetical protein